MNAVAMPSAAATHIQQMDSVRPGQRYRNAGDVAGTNPRRQADREGLEGGDAAFTFGPGVEDLLYHPAEIADLHGLGF